MFIIKLESYSRWKRWMRGTVVKEMKKENVRGISIHDELEVLVRHWASERFDIHLHSICIERLSILSGVRSRVRIEEFCHSLWIYDVRIIHERLHRRYSESLMKLKISFKRQGHKYYDTLKILIRLNTI